MKISFKKVLTVLLMVFTLIGVVETKPVSAEDEATELIYNSDETDNDDAIASETENEETNKESITTSDSDLSTEEEKSKVETEDENNIYTYSDDKVTVTVTVEKDALPEGAELFVTALSQDEAEEQELLSDSIDTNDIVYDIGFKKDEKEIEPTKNANVNIQWNASDVADKIDMDTLTVQHVADDKTVSTVADTTKDGNGEIAKNGETIDMSFTTESFSYFVISYNNNYKIYAHMLDQTGAEFPDTENNQVTVSALYDQANFYNWNRKENIWVNVQTLVSTYGEFTQGYTYASAHVGSADGEEIKWILYSTGRYSSKDGYYGYPKASTWYYSTSEEQPSIIEYGTNPTLDAGSSIYILFNKDHLAQTEIQDNVTTDGSLFLARPSEIPEGATVTYKWYRSKSDEDGFEYAKRQKVTGGYYTVISDDTGTRMYPALDVAITEEYKTDQSLRFWYKVEVYVNGTLYKTTEPIHNMYYASLQNGSFEYPDTNMINNGNGAIFVPDYTDGLHWHTTGTDKQLEIVYAPNASGSYGVSDAPDGNQFAELNAEAAGSLYQDIMSTPNTNLYWRLYHRARQGTDTMYLVVAPTSEVSDITTQSQLTTLVNKIKADPDTYAEKGYYLQTVTDSTSAWGEYSGAYVVPEGCYLTRLFFVAGSTGSGHTTMGNFIDAVAFSSLMPEPDSGNGNITVTKKVEGILDEDIQSYQVQIDVTNKTTGTTISTQTLDFSKAIKQDDGTYEMTFSLPNIAASTDYVIKETVLSDLTGLSTTYETLGSSYSIDGSDEQDYTSDGITTTLTDGTSQTIDIYNRYKPQNVNYTITNTVTGNLANKTKEFAYEVTITDTAGNVETKTFTLLTGGEKVISVPYASKVEVTQADYIADGYQTTYSLNDDEDRISEFTYTVESLKNDMTQHYFNKKYGGVPTGTHSDDELMTSIMMTSVILIAFLYTRKKRKLEQDS